MAGIDSSIPLSVRGVGPIANPLDVMQNITQMRSQREQTAALAEQRRSMAERTRLETEAARRAQAEELHLRRAYQEFGKVGKTPPLATLTGIVGPERAQKLWDAEVATKEREVKSFAEAQERVARAVGAVEAFPENMRAEAFDGTLKEFVGRGWLNPGDVKPYSPEAVTYFKTLGLSADQQITQGRNAAADARAAATHAATLPGVQADTAVKTQVAAGTVGGLTPEQQAAGARATAAQTEAARHNRQTEATARAAAVRQGEPMEAVMRRAADGKMESVLVPRSQSAGMTPATSRERTTEDERKSVGWYKQMRDAAITIDKMEDSLTQQELYQIQTLPHEALVGMANRNALSENAKRYFRAFTQFSEARLRSVSGAAISTGEYQSDRQTYGKQFGETSTLAEDRKRAREVVMEATKSRAGVAMPQEPAAPGAGTGTIRARDPQGNIHEAAKGTPLPAGWTIVGGG